MSLQLKRYGAASAKTLEHLNVQLITVATGNEEAVLSALRNDPTIEFAERDGIAEAAFVPNDIYVVSGAEWHLAKIQAPSAWDWSIGAPGVLVAVLDSGIDSTHPELSSAVVPGYDFVSGDPDPADDFGHGTAVAGTIAAAGNNSLGVAGVAFGCKMLPVKVVNASGFASYSTVAQGIKYAVDRGARVINLSIAGDAPSSTLQSAVDYAWNNNVIVVASAGNNASASPQYPAACDHVVSVSAAEPDDSLAPFSNYGSSVTLCAPGDQIWTTQRDPNAPYGAWRGTSFSSPLVASAAALLASINPTLSNTQIVSLLENNADDIGPAGVDSSFGFGRLNVYRSVASAAALPGGLPPGVILVTPPPVIPPPSTNSSTEILFAPISIATNGFGHVSPSLNGRRLEIGKSYRIRAVPGAGQIFAGWEGTTEASWPPALTFVMRTNLALVAKFVPTPFPPFKGAYSGLLAGTNGVLPGNAGYFTFSVNPLGRFSGKILLGGARHGFHGQFTPAGDAVFSLPRQHEDALQVTLHLDLANGSDQVIGALKDGATVSEISADRNVFNARFHPAQQAGLHSFALTRSDQQETAGATGLARIARSGSSTVRGSFGAGRRFVTASTVSKNGDYPFYLSLNRGHEVVIGWLNFPAGESSVSTGTVLWVSTGTNAFARTLQAASR